MNHQVSKKDTQVPSHGSNGKSRPPMILSFVRATVLSALAVAFLALCAVYCLRCIHDDYFVAIVDRARRTDEDLLEEFTYYQRQCSAADVTATTAAEADQLYIYPEDDGVDQMMMHGAVLFPETLSQETVRELREFVVAKNAAVKGTAEEFPVSQGKNRVSYGIEATEHPAVVKALREIHDNVALKRLLEGLVGPNPALTEITAITSGYGSPDQAWHPDVKPDGNGLMYGRTYSHSYSFFIPLQNTTGDMGATDICPGTHYCAEELHNVCEELKIGMHQVGQAGHWRAGDAALLNQQVWHRGSAHVDPDALDRVVFIVSFLGRPTDTRQLSRGTYFHMKWNMWGHTWQDMADSALSMARPWSILRCLHIWKPSDRNWGFDLFTSAALRIGNNQLGCEPEDLPRLVHALGELGFPEWLDGTIDTELDNAWQVYIRETIANVWDFLIQANAAVVALYMALVILSSFGLGGTAGFESFVRGCMNGLLTLGTIALLSYNMLGSIRQTPWATEIAAGRTLMRPFPPAVETWQSDPSVSGGSTTVPTRQDVLYGNRLDSRTIGAYSRWLEFHPGNRDFLGAVSECGGPLYRAYSGNLPSAFRDRLIDCALEPTRMKNGRFLQQDYRTGHWLQMTESETELYVRQMLYVGRNGPIAELKKEFDLMVADTRFGTSRGTALSKRSLPFLHHLGKNLFGGLEFGSPVDATPKDSTTWKPREDLLKVPSTNFSMDKSQARAVAPMAVSDVLKVGQEVIYRYADNGEQYAVPATIVARLEDQNYEVAFYDETSWDLGILKTVTRDSIEDAPRVTEGTLVWGNYRGYGEWFPGEVKLVWPNGHADILYDDGDGESQVPPYNFATRPTGTLQNEET